MEVIREELLNGSVANAARFSRGKSVSSRKTKRTNPFVPSPQESPFTNTFVAP